jgi:hypothetical protein
LLQFAVEPKGPGPIYTKVRKINAANAAMEPNMKSDTILKFLADSRRYLGS